MSESIQIDWACKIKELHVTSERVWMCQIGRGLQTIVSSTIQLSSCRKTSDTTTAAIISFGPTSWQGLKLFLRTPGCQGVGKKLTVPINWELLYFLFGTEKVLKSTLHLFLTRIWNSEMQSHDDCWWYGGEQLGSFNLNLYKVEDWK